MFLLVSAKHSPAECPAANGLDDARYTESVGMLAPAHLPEKRAWADQHGVTVHFVAFNTPGHEILWVLEAPDANSATKYLMPIKPMSQIELKPLSSVGFPLVPS